MINKVLVVVSKRNPGGNYPDFDIRQTKGTLEYTGLAKSIDVLYSEDSPDLISYCREHQPQIILMCLQGKAIPPVGVCQYIKRSLDIPIVVFWFDTHSAEYADLLDKYSDAVTLNLVGCSDMTSHKPLTFCPSMLFKITGKNQTPGILDIK